MTDIASVTVRRAQGRGRALIASLPHSGLSVPASMVKHLRAPYRAFLPHQDWHLTELYDFLPRLGVATVAATFSRYVIDPNRALREPILGSFWRSAVSEGTPKGDALYETKPSEAQLAGRISNCYEPYHDAVQTLVDARCAAFGTAFVLDLHSFGLDGHDSVCLGDANGTSCDETFTELVETAFRGVGLEVVRNKPFNGGHITRRYGEQAGVQALQVELPYSLYLDHDDLSVGVVPRLGVAPFAHTKRALAAAFGEILNGVEDLASVAVVN